MRRVNKRKRRWIMKRVFERKTKKLLVLMLALGMALLTAAGLVITVGGVPARGFIDCNRAE